MLITSLQAGLDSLLNSSTKDDERAALDGAPPSLGRGSTSSGSGNGPDDGESEPEEIVFHAASPVEPEFATATDSTQDCNRRLPLEIGGGRGKVDTPGATNPLTSELPRTTYTLMYYAPWCSSAMLFAYAIFVLQLGLIVLVLLDQIDMGNVRNPLSIPAGVPPSVTAAQAPCMLLAVMLQEEFIQAVRGFNLGHFSELSLLKFWLSNTLQLVLGLSQLVATFALVMSSRSVIEVAFRFAGLGVVSMIDNAGFTIASYGYVTRSMKEVCERVEDFKRPTNDNESFRLPRALAALAVGVLMTGFGITFYRQLNGFFLCSRLLVEFDDEVRLEFGGYSGEYLLQPGVRYNGRASYLEVVSMHMEGQSMIAYCEQFDAWTHSSWNGTNNESPDPCQRWNARSTDKDNVRMYDPLEASSAPWALANEKTGLPGPLDWVHMVCADCNNLSCSPDNGVCESNKCACHAGRHGVNCAYDSPCNLLAREVVEGGQDDHSVWHILIGNEGTPITHLEKPVYVTLGTRFSEAAFLSPAPDAGLLAFVGRRWAFAVMAGYGDNSEAYGEFLMWILTVKLHLAYNSPEMQLQDVNGRNFFILGLSEPVGVLKQTTIGGVSPVGLKWDIFRRKDVWMSHEPREAPLVRVPTPTFAYSCASCGSTNPCRSGGACLGDGTCECLEGFTGALCEGRRWNETSHRILDDVPGISFAG